MPLYRKQTAAPIPLRHLFSISFNIIFAKKIYLKKTKLTHDKHRKTSIKPIVCLWGVYMGKIKHIILFAGLLLCANFCFAKQIQLQIVQHDDRTDAVSEDSLVIEDELLNGFFETGYIITNSPAAVSCSASDDLILFNKAMGDAYEGSSDFFVQIKLYYTNSLHTIDWSVASVSTGKTIKESKFESSVKAFDEKGLRSVSSRLISEISKILKSTKA